MSECALNDIKIEVVCVCISLYDVIKIRVCMCLHDLCMILLK